MISFAYAQVFAAITAVWILVRIFAAFKSRSFSCKREFQLLLVYICLLVVVRFTFFPLSRVAGKIQPLVFDPARVFPPSIHLRPFVDLMNYPTVTEALLNLIGNITMFIPLGIIWPSVFRKLHTHARVMAAGTGLSLCIEIAQLPFFGRVSDIDDLILNSLGYLLGYLIYLFVKKIRRKTYGHC